MKSIVFTKFTMKSFFPMLILVLSACGTVVTPKSTEQLATLTTMTQTYTPTETKIPTVTKTPTKAATSTETAIPVPKYTEGVATSKDGFTKLTTEQKALVKADIINNPQLPNPEKSEIGYFPRNVGEALELYMGCRYGSDCIVRASIIEENPLGGPDLYKFFIEFRDSDGSDKVIELCINGSDAGLTEENSDGFLERIQGVENGDYLYWIIITQFTGISKDKVDPYAWSVTNGADDGVKNDLGILQSGPKTFPEGLLDDPLVGGVVTQPK